MNEADTCRTYVLPRLKSAGWEVVYITQQRRSVAYLDGLPPIGDLRQAKVNALRVLQSTSGEDLSPSLRFGDDARSALMPSILDKAFKGEL